MVDIDTGKVLWCVENGFVNDLKSELSKSKLHVDDTKLHSTNKGPVIICAADYGQTEVVKYLIEQGSNVNIMDSNGITPLLAAVWEGHAETVELLLQNGADTTMLSPAQTSYIDEAPTDKIKELLRNKKK